MSQVLLQTQRELCNGTDHIPAVHLKAVALQPGTTKGVPHHWGNNFIIYDSRVVPRHLAWLAVKWAGEAHAVLCARLRC